MGSDTRLRRHRCFATLALFAAMLSPPDHLLAQKEYNHWYVNNNLAIDFNVEPPLIDTTFRPMNASYKTIAISDRHSGRLLFWFNDDVVRDSSGGIMPGHTPIPWDGWGDKVIIPDPSDSLRYYLFYPNSFETGDFYRPRRHNPCYKVVDMRERGGLGSIVHVVEPLDSGATESYQMVGIGSCDRESFWVLLTVWSGGLTDGRPSPARFHAYHVTSNGVSSSPVVSPFMVTRAPAGGIMKASPTGRQIAVATRSELVVLRFDPLTGTVSDPVTIARQGSMQYAGMSYSPDGSLLYAMIARSGRMRLTQFDVTRHDSASIVASGIEIDSIQNTECPSMQLGPDRRLYLSFMNSLRRIRQPNLRGTACELEPAAIAPSLPGWLPNLIDGLLLGSHRPLKAYAAGDTSICLGDTVRLRGSGGSYQEWTFADGISCTACSDPFVSPKQSTTYIMRAWDDCGNEDFDSVTVVVNATPVADAGEPQTICRGDSVRLSATGGVSYTWSPAAGLSCTDCADPVARPLVTTTYRVGVASENGCVAEDSVTVSVGDVPVADAGPSRVICRGASTRLEAAPAPAWHWQPAAGLSCTDCQFPVAAPQSTTTYYLTATGAAGCSAIDSVTVEVVEQPTADAGADVTICLGEQVRLRAGGTGSIRWEPADGLSCTDCPDPWAAPAATTRYILTRAEPRASCSATDTVMVTVVDTLAVDAGASVGICRGTSVRLHGSDGAAWQWSPADGLSCTDCQDPVASPATTTRYTLVVTSPGGCRGSDTVTVTVLERPEISVTGGAVLCPGGATQLGVRGGVRWSWSPADGLSCTDCADPIARPEGTTRYIVEATDASGCVGIDSVLVEVRPERRIAGHIARDHGGMPGQMLDIPLVIDEPIEDQGCAELVIELTYRASAARIGGVATTGTLLDGWLVQEQPAGAGNLRLVATAPPGVTFSGSGTLLTLRLQAYISDSLGFELPARVTMTGDRCQRIEMAPGRVTIDSVCGLEYRLLEMAAQSNALGPIEPNPSHTTAASVIRVAFDAPVVLEMLDAEGRVIATPLSAPLTAGDHRIEWSTAELPSGLYHCRLRIGTWDRVRSVVVVR